jgi:hypothetical protein
MLLSYYRDPQIFQGMSPLHAAMRRRLWVSIMEISVQEAVASAMPPLVSLDDFDTEPALNINDDEIGKSTKTPPILYPPTVYTQTTFQLPTTNERFHVIQILQILTEHLKKYHIALSPKRIFTKCHKTMQRCVIEA